MKRSLQHCEKNSSSILHFHSGVFLLETSCAAKQLLTLKLECALNFSHLVISNDQLTANSFFIDYRTQKFSYPEVSRCQQDRLTFAAESLRRLSGISISYEGKPWADEVKKNPKLMAKSHIQKKKEKPKSRQRSSRCQHRRDLKSHRCRIHTIVDQQRAPEALGNTPRDYPAIEMPTARTPEERTPRPPPCFLPALVRPPVGDPDLPVPFTNKSLKRRIP